MFPECSEIEELAGTYDTAPSYVSVYLNVKQDGLYQRYIKQRVHEISKALKGHRDWLQNFNQTMEKVDAVIEKEAPRSTGLAIIASVSNDFMRIYNLGVAIDNQLILDTSPYIRPLTEMADDMQPFALLLLDERKAEIYLIDVGEIKEKDRLSHNVMNRHKMGGCSQRRFQRLRQGSVQAFYKEVVEHLDDILKGGEAERVIIAAHPTARGQFKELLPQHICQMIAGEMDLGDWKEAICKAEELAMEAEHEYEHALVQKLREEIMKGGNVAYGINSVLEAVKQGRADIVLMLESEKIPGWRCESCRETGVGAAGECPVCSTQTFQVDILEEITEMALAMDTAVENVEEDDALAELGGVAAFLRW
jgi:peptide chain release factor subunit 1